MLTDICFNPNGKVHISTQLLKTKFHCTKSIFVFLYQKVKRQQHKLKKEIQENPFQAEDAVCLADYCDIMRCNVLVTQDAKIAFPENGINTDVEIWQEATAYRTALATSGPRDLARYTVTVREGVYKQNKVVPPPAQTPTEPANKQNCEKSTPSVPQDSSNAFNTCFND